MNEWVWIHEERVYGELLNYGTYFSTVRYEKDGLLCEVLLENDEFELRSERAFDYEADTE